MLSKFECGDRVHHWSDSSVVYTVVKVIPISRSSVWNVRPPIGDSFLYLLSGVGPYDHCIFSFCDLVLSK